MLRGSLTGGERVGRKKAIVKKKSDEGSKEEPREYLAPGGVKKFSNAVVSGRMVGSMSYDPKANLDARVKQKSDRFCMST